MHLAGVDDGGFSSAFSSLTLLSDVVSVLVVVVAAATGGIVGVVVLEAGLLDAAVVEG